METRLFFNLLELIAFLSSIYYYRKSNDKFSLILVCYLAFTVFVEIIGWYNYFINDFSFLNSLKGTVFEQNYWLYNIQLLISMIFYVTYFKLYLKSKNLKRVLNVLLVLFVLTSVLYLVFSGIYFVAFSPFTVIVGTLLIFLSIFFYYLELLNSNEILRVHKTLPFYVSVAALIFHLCTTPLFIYSTYFSESHNPEFFNLYIQVIFSCNFIMYSLYIIGFFICARNKNHYYGKKLY